MGHAVPCKKHAMYGIQHGIQRAHVVVHPCCPVGQHKACARCVAGLTLSPVAPISSRKKVDSRKLTSFLYGSKAGLDVLFMAMSKTFWKPPVRSKGGQLRLFASPRTCQWVDRHKREHANLAVLEPLTSSAVSRLHASYTTAPSQPLRG